MASDLSTPLSHRHLLDLSDELRSTGRAWEITGWCVQRVATVLYYCTNRIYSHRRVATRVGSSRRRGDSRNPNWQRSEPVLVLHLNVLLTLSFGV